MIEGKFALRIRYKKGYSGVLVAQCVDMPFIVVEGKTPDELFKEIGHELSVYFSTFPEEGNRLIEQLREHALQDVAKTEPVRELEEGWTEKEIELPIPRRR